MCDCIQDIINFLLEEDTPNSHFLDHTDAELQLYIAQTNDPLNYLMSAEAASKELARRQRIREAFFRLQY